MIASRNPSSTTATPSNTACPPLRSFVAGDARRRGQACTRQPPNRNRLRRRVAHPGDGIAGVDNAQHFAVIVDG
jgi:hypothetical protein